METEWLRLQRQFDELDGVTLRVTLRNDVPRDFQVHAVVPSPDPNYPPQLAPRRAEEFRDRAKRAAELLTGDDAVSANDWFGFVWTCRHSQFTVCEVRPVTEKLHDGTSETAYLMKAETDQAGLVCADAAGELAIAARAERNNDTPLVAGESPTREVPDDGGRDISQPRPPATDWGFSGGCFRASMKEVANALGTSTVTLKEQCRKKIVWRMDAAEGGFDFYFKTEEKLKMVRAKINKERIGKKRKES